MQCLCNYKWVKLPRNLLPQGKGIMGDWAKLAARAAFRRGNLKYCGFSNPVTPGMWAGGIVGVKAMLGVRSKQKAQNALARLAEKGYLNFAVDAETKYLTYQITDWVMECAGRMCLKGNVTTTEGYGFLCLPRNITERLVQENYIFDEADAWLDLWCHTVSNETRNAFSFYAPVCQFHRSRTLLTLETLGKRWNWDKTKVWRFFHKHSDVFSLVRLPSSLGCLVFNLAYPTDHENTVPDYADILRILDRIRIYAANVRKKGSLHDHMSRMIAWFSKRMLEDLDNDPEAEAQTETESTMVKTFRAWVASPTDCNSSTCGSRETRNPFLIDMQALAARWPCKLIYLTKEGEELIGWNSGSES